MDRITDSFKSSKINIKGALSVTLSIIIALTVLSGLSFDAYADMSGTSGDLEWYLDYETETLVVSGNGYGEDYEYSNVSSEGNPPWYNQRQVISHVVIEDGVLGIGSDWFHNCYRLTDIDFGSTCHKLGAKCFSGCTGLTGIELPSGIDEFEDYLFYQCTSLKWAIINSDNSAERFLHKLPNYMFYGCTALEEVYVAEGYTNIGARCFYDCVALHGIVWRGDAVSSLGSYAFRNVPSSSLVFFGGDAIKSWAISKGYSVGETAGFCGNNLTYSYDYVNRLLNLDGSGDMSSCPWSNFHYFICDIAFPDTNESISICSYAFNGCELLGDTISIPSNIGIIGSNAFYGIGSKSIYVNAPSLNLGENAFGGKTGLVFYGVKNSGLYDFVKDNRTEDQSWLYYCLNDDHNIVQTVIEPTCTISGYTAECCKYCDFDNGKSNIVSALGHDYYLQCRSKQKLYYNCNRCDEIYHYESSQNMLSNFSDAVILDKSAHPGVFDTRYDIYKDGYINAKDYKVLCDMNSGKNTKFDFNLNNRNATPQTKKVFRFIADTYRYGIITGQQESTWMGSPDYEINYICSNTGKKPAIRGFDFMNDDYNGVVNRAIQWWNQGGIVTICWHCSKNFDKGYEESKADELSEAQWNLILTEGTNENKAFLSAMDKAGNALKRLQDAGVPVLWRPFHEFDGAWFWWGKGGSTKFKKLWIMMYNHFTYDLGLNNLIWVLGYSHNGTMYGGNLANWYPGNQYCDIVGADTYEVAQNGAESRLYVPVNNVCDGTKPLAMHECGKIPTVSQFKNVPWGFFMTWHTNYITDENTASSLNEIYNSDYAITLDELPSFN